MDTNQSNQRLSRREVVQWLIAAGVAISARNSRLFGASAPAAADAKGYGTDPDLMKFYQPGDIWPLTLTDVQRRTVSALCDVILPDDHLGPAASSIGVPSFIDEWISAPYPAQMADRPIILDGLRWLETESQKRFKADFSVLTIAQQRNICDDICYEPNAKPEFEQAAAFFSKFRDLCAGGYYSTPPGWKAIGYVGNTPLATFDGPPIEVLKQLGVEQTVI